MRTRAESVSDPVAHPNACRAVWQYPAARTVQDAFAEQTLEMSPDLVKEPAPQNIPNTMCLSGDIAHGRMTTCTMVYGRYVAQICGHRPVGNADPESDSLRTLSRRVATRYVEFVRAEEAGPGEN